MSRDPGSYPLTGGCAVNEGCDRSFGSWLQSSPKRLSVSKRPPALLVDGGSLCGACGVFEERRCVIGCESAEELLVSSSDGPPMRELVCLVSQRPICSWLPVFPSTTDMSGLELVRNGATSRSKQHTHIFGLLGRRWQRS